MQSPDKQRFRYTTGLLLLISIAVLASVTSSTPTQTLDTTEGTEGANGSTLLTAPAGLQAAGATNLPRNADPTAGSAAISPAANPRGEGSRFNNTSATGRVGEEGAGGAMTATDSNGAANGKAPEGDLGGRGANGHGTPEGEGGGAANGHGTGTANGKAPEGEGDGAANGKAPEGDLGGRGANGHGTGAADDNGGGTPPGSDGARSDGTTDSETRTSDPFGLADDLLKQADMPPRTWEPLSQPAQIIYKGLPGTKEQPRLYLTFDDGPHPTWTPRFLDLLDRYGARATFFLVGEWAAAYPEVVREIVERGHTLGNHLWSHTHDPFDDEELFRREVRNTAAALGEGITNCLRPPYGKINEQIHAWSGEEGYEVVLWSADIQDWRPENDIESLRKGLLAQIQEGGTILLLHEHSGNKTLTALDEALASLTSRGWRVDTPICPLEF